MRTNSGGGGLELVDVGVREREMRGVFCCFVGDGHKLLLATGVVLLMG